MSPVRYVIYLHGFASSPASSKAQRFARELGARGVGFVCPDLNQPAFETLTVTRMLGQVREVLAQVPTGPVAVVGSSLGGFVAVHAAAAESAADSGGRASAKPKIDRLVLLAPAFEFGTDRIRPLGEHGMDEWRRSGRLRVFHYAANEYRDVHFALHQDAATYDAFSLSLALPTLVFQGRHDDAVDPASVERWASGRPYVDLRLVDDGHQLTASMDLMWQESEKFLGLAG
jgi:pimeloyl-ACP methyl ester carboxylesterase